MVNHLKNVHRGKYAEFLKKSNESMKMTQFISVTKLPTVSAPLFDPEEFQTKLVKFIVNTDQPFSLVEDEDFKDIIHYITNQEYELKLPKRRAIRTLIHEAYTKEFEKIKTQLLENDSKISFSVDCWSSSNGYAFQGVVAHWITDDWQLQTVVLDLSIIEGSHSGANLAESFGNVLTRFEIWSKLLAVTSDNASNMTTFLKKLETLASDNGGAFRFKDFRVRCMAHIINLSCQEIIKSLNGKTTTYLDGSDSEEEDFSVDNLSFIEKIRRSSAGIRSSPQRREQLAKQCSVEGLDFKNAILDVRTRWNSSYDMLARALEIRKPFELTVQSFSQLKNLMLTTDDWVKVVKTLILLKPFKEATNELSEEGVPKLSQTISIYNALFEHLEKYSTVRSTEYREGREHSRSGDAEGWLQSAVDAGWAKLMDYYPTSDGLVFLVATGTIIVFLIHLNFRGVTFILPFTIQFFKYISPRSQCSFIADT